MVSGHIEEQWRFVQDGNVVRKPRLCRPVRYDQEGRSSILDQLLDRVPDHCKRGKCIEVWMGPLEAEGVHGHRARVGLEGNVLLAFMI